MNVLKHDPMSFFMSHFKKTHSFDILSLTQGDTVEVLAWFKSTRFTDLFCISDGVNPLEESDAILGEKPDFQV